MNHLYRITAPHFVAGIVVGDGKVTGSAPILKYMRGWTMARVETYCYTKSWRLDLI